MKATCSSKEICSAEKSTLLSLSQESSSADKRRILWGGKEIGSKASGMLLWLAELDGAAGVLHCPGEDVDARGMG